MGDGLMAIFRSAADAVSCGVAMQRSVWLVNRDRGDATVEMRVGLSAGEAAEEEGDWHGTPVDRGDTAMRRSDARAGPRGRCRARARRLAGDVRFDEGASYDLKGLPEPLRAFAARWEPPRASTAAPLPAALDLARRVFVGRRTALAELPDATTQARSSGRQVVLISGEPGPGQDAPRGRRWRAGPTPTGGPRRLAAAATRSPTFLWSLGGSGVVVDRIATG